MDGGRHEHKYYINYLDYTQLRARLARVAQRDAHAGPNGRYMIRSLYFDNYADKAVAEKLSGLSRREKFRLRYYNGDTSFIRLEKKSKHNRLCYKESAPVTGAQCASLINGDFGSLRESGAPLGLELYTKMQCQHLRPRTIVDYTREAFIYGPGNVRVTFDSDIRTSGHIAGFLDPRLVTVPSARAVILEIKFDGFLPEIIRNMVQLGSRHETEFSKYVVSRLV